MDLPSGAEAAVLDELSNSHQDVLARSHEKLHVHIYLRNSLKKHLIIFPYLAFSTLPQSEITGLVPRRFGAAAPGPCVSHLVECGFHSWSSSSSSSSNTPPPPPERRHQEHQQADHKNFTGHFVSGILRTWIRFALEETFITTDAPAGAAS